MKHLAVTVLAVFLVIAAGILSFVLVPRGEDMLSGKVITQVYVYETPAEGCAVNLTQGINMVSFYCETGDSSLNDSLQNRNNESLDYNAVYVYNPNDPLDSWSSYNPSLPSWAVQSVSSLNRRNGFVIRMNQNGEYYKDGYRFMNTGIDLSPGWNFIGYPSDVEINITTALTQIAGKYTRVEAYTPVNETKTWLYHVPIVGGTLSNMTPMVGYWIYMTESAHLNVNW
jgi:hypothetical protein